MSDDVSHGFGAAMVPDDGLSEEVDVDLDDDGGAPPSKPKRDVAPAASASAPAPAVPRGSVPPPADRAPETPRVDVPVRAEPRTEPKKARPRMSLRVPDDEVVRPLSRTGETRVFRPEELDRPSAPPPEGTNGTGARKSVPAEAERVVARESGAAAAPSGSPPRRPASAPPLPAAAMAPVSSTAVSAEPAPTAGVPPAPPARPRSPSMSSEIGPAPRPRAPSISSETSGLPVPPTPPPLPKHRTPSMTNEASSVRPRAGSVSSEVSAPPPPLPPRRASITNEAPAPPPRPPPPSPSSEVTRVAAPAPMPVEALRPPEPPPPPAPPVAPEEIKPTRVISVAPPAPAPNTSINDAETVDEDDDVPTDVPTLTDLPAVRDSSEVLAVAAAREVGAPRRDSSDGIPIVEEIEPSELRSLAPSPAPPEVASSARPSPPPVVVAPPPPSPVPVDTPPRARATDPAPPPEPRISASPPRAMRAPAMTIPDADGGIDIPVDEDTGEPLPEPEIASDDLLSVESAPDVFPLSKPAEPTSRPIPPVGMSSEPNVAQSITQTPPGGIEVGPPRGSAPAATPAAATPAAASPAAAASAPAAREPDAGPKSPRVIVPSASPLAPQPLEAARKRQRPWWEDLFNDDYIRTMTKITDEQIAREVDFIEDSLGVARGAMILDMACGTGRHAIELTQRGYRVVGLDLSLAMLAKAAEEAQERGQKLNFVQGDMREMTFEDMFDGVYCWNTSFGFFEEERNAQVIQRVHRALRKGGQFVLDVMNRDFALSQQPSLVWFEGDGCICMDEMQIDWITSRMRVKRTMMMDDGRSREIEYSLRIYSLHELGKMLHDHGFRVAEVSGRVGTPGVFFGAESPNVLVLAEKR